jgi:hypothetical protein
LDPGSGPGPSIPRQRPVGPGRPAVSGSGCARHVTFGPDTNETPEVATAGRQCARLQTRLEQLKKQHAWGDLSDGEFQNARDATRSALAELPDGDRIRTFDAYRARVLELPDAIEAASPARREELSRIVVKPLVIRDRRLASIKWIPAVRPFFEGQRECPQGDSNP